MPEEERRVGRFLRKGISDYGNALMPYGPRADVLSWQFASLEEVPTLLGDERTINIMGRCGYPGYD